MASDLVLTLNANAFAAEKLKEYGTFFVDFWAPWCAPCRMVAPVVEDLAKDFTGKVTFGKLNIDDYPDIAERYDVGSIPTMVLFKNGVEVERTVGVGSKNSMAQMINRHLL